MTKVDYSVESEEEFYEDFSGWEITDDELDEILGHARRTDDIKLRRLVKQHQYFRWLLRNLINLSEDDDAMNKIRELASVALRTKNKSSNYD